MLAHMLTRLEHERFSSPRLLELGAMLASEGVPPSRRIAQLCRRIDLLDARRNQLFLPFSCLLLWGTQFAHAIRVVARGGGAVGAALAGGGRGVRGHLRPGRLRAWKTPRTRFRTWSTRPAGRSSRPTRWAILIPQESCVRNDVRLGGEHPQALVVSGSNMSEEHACCSTVGVNTSWRSPARPCGRAG
ncbi:MAG: hypothetical protein MZV64_28125 [Ignavibacteriales bacterium]|nr:hypothetical protein [Ignavibacteriales bacterium]